MDTAENTDTSGGREVKNLWNLEPNHSHYLIVDDGIRLPPSLGHFRTKLCVELNKSNDENEFPSESITYTYWCDEKIPRFREQTYSK